MQYMSSNKKVWSTSPHRRNTQLPWWWHKLEKTTTAKKNIRAAKSSTTCSLIVRAAPPLHHFTTLQHKQQNDWPHDLNGILLLCSGFVHSRMVFVRVGLLWFLTVHKGSLFIKCSSKNIVNGELFDHTNQGMILSDSTTLPVVQCETWKYKTGAPMNKMDNYGLYFTLRTT